MDKKTLKQYQFIMKEIDLLEEEYANILAGTQHGKPLVSLIILDDIISPADMDPNLIRAKGNTPDPTATAAAKMGDIAALIKEKLLELRKSRLEIEAIIGCLPAQERLLMRMRYIYCLRWEQIAVEMNYSCSHVKNWHGRILSQY